MRTSPHPQEGFLVTVFDRFGGRSDIGAVLR